MKNKLALAIFPCLQVLFFYGAILSMNISVITSVFMLILASLFMAYALHITIHYHVHHKPKKFAAERTLDIFYTILLGMPFQTYQRQHFMHHKYNNLPNDITSTFKEVNGELRSKSWFLYSFFWIREAVNFKEFTVRCSQEGFYSNKVKLKARYESLVNLIVFCLLISLSWKFALVFISMIYIGWIFISLINYGQHLPEMKQLEKAYSYYGKWYNLLLLNNGLHAEHHDKPAIKYWDLKEDRNTGGVNKSPHIIEPLIFSSQNQES